MSNPDTWLQDGPLLYRVTDDRHPVNRDEISVTMADGSRDLGARTKRASELLASLAPTEAAAMAATVPAGFKLVPVVPTEAMVQAGACEDTTTTESYQGEVEVSIGNGAALRVYSEMLKAAPQAPVAGQPAEADAIVGWEIEYKHFSPTLTVHKAHADEAVRLGFTVHALGRLAPKGDSNG